MPKTAMQVFVLGNYMNAHFVHVACLPQAGESLAATRVFQEHGGKGLNLGLGLTRLGAQVVMPMAVGADAAGVAVRQALNEAGLDTRWIVTLGDESGFGVGFIAADGRNFLAANLGANALLTPQHIADCDAAMAGSDWALAHFEAPDAVVLETFRRARAHGALTYLNPSPWRAITPELLALTDALVVNETEAAYYFALPAVPAWTRAEWAARLPELARGAGWSGRWLIVTLAAQGSVALAANGEVAQAAAYPVTQIDATGAGDAFSCGFVHALHPSAASNDPAKLEAALRCGNACGAHIAAREGIFAHLPGREALAAYPSEEWFGQ